MAFSAKLSVGGSFFKVLSCNFEFQQTTSPSNNRPIDYPTGGTVNLTIESQTDDKQIWQWMIDGKGQKSGSIIFYTENNLPLKTIAFEEAYCVGLEEIFHHVNDGLHLSFTLSAKTLVVNGIKHTKDWVQ